MTHITAIGSPHPRALTLLLLGALTGCWDGVRNPLPRSEVGFTPLAGAIDGWTVTEQEVEVACPDGRNARLLWVHPDAEISPVPTAVIYHSGSFDAIADPSPDAPLQGIGLYPTSHLEIPWTVRQAWATVGMVPSPSIGETHEGALPLALAQQGIASLLPMNCWGDLWHNRLGTVDNDFEGDRFFRTGGSMADWGWRLATDPAFADAIRVELPYTPDPDAVVLIGLGEGGRAVGEVLTRGAEPSVVVLDSHDDDLSVVSALGAGRAQALDRIFNGADPMAEAFSSVPTLPPTIWVRSEADPLLAAGGGRLVTPRLTGPEHTVIPRTDDLHVLTNADQALAEQVVDLVDARL